jgi:hypothetical protein
MCGGKYMKEELKEDISYYKKWVKTDLENAQTGMEQGQLNYIQWLQSLNTNLDRIYNLSMIMGNHSVCTFIQDYRNKQHELENQQEKLQKQLFENAKEMNDKLLKEL